MGLFDKLFGLGLVIAGISIAVYFTLWTFMVLVTIHCFNAISSIHIAFICKQVASLFQRFLLRPSLVVQAASSCTPRRCCLDHLLVKEHNR